MSKGYKPRHARLSDVADLVTGYPFESAYFAEHPLGPRLLLGANVAPETISWTKLRHWPMPAGDGMERHHLRSGDIILAMDRPWIPAGLKLCRVSNDDVPSLLVQRVARLRARDGVDQTFLYASLRAPAFTDYILGVQTGTTVPHISASQIMAYEIELPPIEEQRRIAAVLGALDDKIELNRKMNRTLEGMAQALFKSWFIDFDGRGDFEDSELGPIPRGWTVESLDQVADFLNGAACQRYPALEGEASLPVVKIRELNQGISEATDRATADIPSKWHVHDGDVLFSWSGSLVVTIWTGGPGALNQHLFKVTSERFPRWFFYLWTNHHLAEFQRIAADKATTMGHIKRHHLTDAKCIIPPPDTLTRFHDTLDPIIQRQVNTALESRTLAQLRDLLLPKLISGEIRVPESINLDSPL